MAPRGGKREGAGRPRQEPTERIRVPVSKLSVIKEQLLYEKYSPLPLYACKVQAGFPSPADDYIERYLDLNKEFIKHPAATFLVKATGDSMLEAGIFPGDILLVDKSLNPTEGKVVIAAIDGELTVKRISYVNGRVHLVSANPLYKTIEVASDQDMRIWGVVTLVLHEL